jgi:hypothetical protein
MKHKTAQYDYGSFQEVGDGAWIPCLHKAKVMLGTIETVETMRIGNLAVNQPISEGLFVAEPFFKGVEFVDSFEKVYE